MNVTAANAFLFRLFVPSCFLYARQPLDCCSPGVCGIVSLRVVKFFCTLVESVISNRNGNSVASLKVGCFGGEAVSFVSNFFRCEFCFVGYLFSRGMCHNNIYVLQLYFLLAAEGFVCILSFSKCQLFTFVCILSFFKCQLCTL